MKRLKILISAHELSPYQGSECAEGWNLVTRIARYHDVTVLYARGSQFAPDAYETATKKYYAENKNEFNIQFIPVSQPKSTLWLARLNKRLSKNTSGIGISFLYFIGYRLWQKAAYRTAQSLLDSCALSPEPYLLVHHLTQITFREPGYLWKLPVPFVWGPTGGTTTIPVSFYRHIGLRAVVYELFRLVTNRLNVRFSSRINNAIKRSSLIYAFSAEDQELFQRRGAGRVEVMLDAGCQSPVSGFQSFRVSEFQSLKVIWVGQLIKRKALDILLKAIAGDPDLINNIQLTIVGDGPLRKKYENLIKKLHLTSNLQPATCNQQPATSITFTGWLPRDEVFDYMKRSDVLVHTSYREGTPHVVLEALSAGIPVICHDISGISIAVTGDCGIKVPLISYKHSILGFREALRVSEFQGFRVSGFQSSPRSSAALRRAQELSWDSMAERISTAYTSLV